MEAPSPTFCVLPWIHLCATVDGVWARCCLDRTAYHESYWSDDPEPSLALPETSLGCVPRSHFAPSNPDRTRTLEQAFDSPEMRETRRAMLEGRAVDACRYCYEREEQGAISYRMHANKQFGEAVDIAALIARTAADGSVGAFPFFLDLRFGNACNLECVMCSYPASSRWGRRAGKPWLEAHIDPYADDEDFFRTLEANVHRLGRVHFAGGEPFMQRRQFELVDLLLRSGSAPGIELVYTTNLTLLPRGFLERLRPFKSVEIAASCDGVGAVFEQIRVGGKWERFVRNLDEVQANDHVQVSLMASPQRDNAGHLGELIDWGVGRGLHVDLMNVVMEPQELSIRSLPPAEKALRTREFAALARKYDSTRPRIARALRHLVVYATSGEVLSAAP
jgi:molybdenum cofactor biosynthesis enzyme MoaA